MEATNAIRAPVRVRLPDQLRGVALPIATGVVTGGVLILHYAGLDHAPPGFFIDEAGVAYDAQGIATDGRDSHGAFAPLFFLSFGTWRCSLFVYAVAAAFKLFGPGVIQARAVATTFSLVTAALLAVLVWQLFRARWLALGTFFAASVTPWLFTVGRLAFEPVALPAVLTAFLVLWHLADRSQRWYHGLAAGAMLGLSVYAYVSAWLFAPLLCLAIVLAEMPRIRWRLLLATGAGAALAVLPASMFMHANPGALTARYQVVSVWQSGHPWLENLGRVWRVYTSGFDPGYLFGGSWPAAGGQFFGILAAALVIGLLSLWSLRREPFWRLVLLGLLLAPVPAALTADFSHPLRNLEAVPFYMTIMSLGVWRLAPLLDQPRGRLVAAAMAGLLAVQAVWFLSDYYAAMPPRMAGWQGAGFQQAVKDTMRYAQGGPIALTPDLLSASTLDPEASSVPFAFFAQEDLTRYRQKGIGGMNARIHRPDEPLPNGAVVLTLPSEEVPGAHILERVTVTYPDSWGKPQKTPVFVIWRVD